jgi:hypothetical protein
MTKPFGESIQPMHFIAIVAWLVTSMSPLLTSARAWDQIASNPSSSTPLPTGDRNIAGDPEGGSTTETSPREPGPNDLPYEEECKQRILTWEKQLKELAAHQNLAGLQVLKTAVEAQMALAELRIKVREAAHAKAMTWGTLLLPAVTAIAGALIGTWVTWKKG